MKTTSLVFVNGGQLREIQFDGSPRLLSIGLPQTSEYYVIHITSVKNIYWKKKSSVRRLQLLQLEVCQLSVLAVLAG